MRKILVIVGVVVLAMAVSMSAFAQDSEPEEGPVITVVQTVPVMASVKINVNGETYVLAIPATLNIDAQTALADAIVSAETRTTVGVLDWIIVDITEEPEAYVHSQYRSSEVSSDENKLVIVTSAVTNLDNETIDPDYTSIVEALGYDDLGNTYEVEDRYCEETDPGETSECVFVFDVPLDVEIVGLDLEVPDRKRLEFQGPENE